MKKNDHLYLKDMLIAINETESFVAGIDFEIFLTVKVIEKAVVKNIRRKENNL